MEAYEKELRKILEEKYISKQKLINWLVDHIEMEWSHIEHDELRSGIENEFCRGRAKAYEELLNEIWGNK